MYLSVSRPLFNIWLYIIVLHQTLYAFPSVAASHCNSPLLDCNTPQFYSSLTLRPTLSLPPLFSLPTGTETNSTPSQSFTMPASSSTLNPITTTLHDQPRMHVKAWLKEVMAYARSLSPKLDVHGALYLVCPDLQWAVLERNQLG